MIGYHYTAIKNWLKIKDEGLKPYWLERDYFLECFPTSRVFGIWIWSKKLDKSGHIGSVLYQCFTKASPLVAYMKVRYNEEDIMKGEIGGKYGNIQLNHSGTFGKFHYHNGNQKAYIVQKPIPIKDIEFIRIYDFKKAFME